MEGYKFSTNWLPFRTQKPDDDRYSAPLANKYRGRYLMLQFHLFLLGFSFSTFCARCCSIMLINKFLLSGLLRLCRLQWYRGDTGSFTCRHLTLSHRSHRRINAGIPPFIAQSLTITLDFFIQFFTFPPIFPFLELWTLVLSYSLPITVVYLIIWFL